LIFKRHEVTHLFLNTITFGKINRRTGEFFAYLIGCGTEIELGKSFGQCQFFWQVANGSNPSLWEVHPPVPPKSGASTNTSTLVAAHDPNELVGPAGYGTQNYLGTNGMFAYHINF